MLTALFFLYFINKLPYLKTAWFGESALDVERFVSETSVIKVDKFVELTRKDRQNPDASYLKKTSYWQDDKYRFTLKADKIQKTDKIFKGKREPMLILASVVTFLGMLCFPFIKSQLMASGMLFILGVFAMVTGVIWAIAGDMGGRAFSSTIVGVLDWAVYMGAAIQAVVFGFVKDTFGWSAIFVTIGSLYIILLILTLLARKMKTKRI